MRKLILTATGKEIKLQDLVDKLFADNVIAFEDEPKIPTNIYYYIKKLADKKGWKFEKMAGFLDAIDSIYEGAALQMILREIAIELDSDYRGNIKDNAEVWGVSLATQSVMKFSTAPIKNWKVIAAFRSETDAKLALKIIMNFSNEK